MTNYEILQWDSDFFGFKVARITSSGLSSRELVLMLKKLKGNNVKLVYWACDSEHVPPEKTVQDHGGLCVNERVTYGVYLPGLNLEKYPPPFIVDEFTDSKASPQLEKLAVLSGRYSRFNLDPNIPPHKFKEMYLLWINQSINGSMADHVFVVKINNLIRGMVTVSIQNEIGRIGLLSVDPDARSRRVGTTLVRFAQNWYISQGCKTAKVVTQKENVQACRLYEKCNYIEEITKNYYHFWL